MIKRVVSVLLINDCMSTSKRQNELTFHDHGDVVISVSRRFDPRKSQKHVCMNIDISLGVGVS